GVRIMWRWHKRAEGDFREEIHANIALDADQRIAEGWSPEEAKAAALRAFGNVTRAQERFYESHRLTWLDDLGRAVRVAFRSFIRNPGFTAVAVVTLALGIGANAAVFSVSDALLRRPLPYPDADRLVALRSVYGSSETPGHGASSARDLSDWQAQAS